MERKLRADALISNISEMRLTRRGFTRYLMAIGAAPLAGGLLAACGGDDDDDDDPPADDADPTATEEPDEPDEPTEEPDDGGEDEPTEEPEDDADETEEPDDEGDEEETEEPGEPPAQGQSIPLPYDLEEPGTPGGQLIIGETAEPDSANPMIASASNLAGVFANVFEGLTQIDPTNGSAMPLLANSWEISDDGLVYSFTIQEGVTWHDGTPFTAQDAKFTYDLIFDEASASPRHGSWTGAVESVELVDDSNLTITLIRPNAPFLTTQGVQGIIPMHIMQDVPPAELAQHSFSTGEQGVTIGTGPFMFEEWVSNDYILFAKYEDYWQGAPYLDTFVHRVVPSPAVIGQQLRTGEIDIAYLQPPDLESMQAEESLTVVTYDSARTVWYGYQLDPERSTLFQEKEVRQALFYALDRPPMVEVLEFGLAQVAVGMMTPISWAFDPDAVELHYEHDLDLANQMLDDAGWVMGDDGVREKDGQRLSFTMHTFSGDDLLEQYLVVMQQQWAEVGAEMTPQFEESNAFISRITSTHDFDMFLFNNSMGSDPDQSIYWTCGAYESGFNMTRYCNEQVDMLAEQGLAATSNEDRQEIYTELQNIMVDELPVAFMIFQQRIMAVNNRVHNYFPNALRTWVGQHKWWVDS